MQRVLGPFRIPLTNLRITSAHAESTLLATLPSTTIQDHLCACREYLSVNVLAPVALGSPLRMQRVRDMTAVLREDYGITSAHAEST